MSILKKIVCFTATIIMFTGCSDFLDTENYTKKTTANWPKSVTDAEQMITGIYNSINQEYTNYVSHFFTSELASDDRFGGGGQDDQVWQAIDKFMNYGSSMFEAYWKYRYQGINRANMAIQALDNVTEWDNNEQRNQLMGEAHFLRGYFYFTLVQMFGEVPMPLSTLPENLTKFSAADVYAQVAYDLKQAIELLPSKPYNSVLAGHATKWAAEALMARVYLFYTGYYKQEALPAAGGGTVTNPQVISWLEDCIANSGHSLVSDYRNIWAYTNEYSGKDYKFVTDNKLKWEGDGCKETVFAAKFSIASSTYRNILCQAFGFRQSNGRENTFPFARGYGAGTVNPNLWNEWLKVEPNDIRRSGSIVDVKNEYPNYVIGADSQMEDSRYWQKKYIGCTCFDDAGNFVLSYTIPMFNFSGSYSNSYNQDLILIRFADVYLMHAELKQDPTGINKVRTRAGLPPIGSYSLEALKQERRFELCFEGQRYYDLMRWGDAPEALSKQEGQSIQNAGVDVTMRTFGDGYKARYLATGGFWPIPNTQIVLSEGVLTQNPGWGTPDVDFSGW